MKKLVCGFLLCCAIMVFAASCGSFASTIGTVTFDTPKGVLGYFDIEVKVPNSPSGKHADSHDPAIIVAIKGEIERLGGTRAINVELDGKETFSGIIARVRGTVVNADYGNDDEDSLDDYYRKLRRTLEQLKEKYPDYPHPDFQDDE
jgi:hypothetical protein